MEIKTLNKGDIKLLQINIGVFQASMKTSSKFSEDALISAILAHFINAHGTNAHQTEYLFTEDDTKLKLVINSEDMTSGTRLLVTAFIKSGEDKFATNDELSLTEYIDPVDGLEKIFDTILGDIVEFATIIIENMKRESKDDSKAKEFIFSKIMSEHSKLIAMHNIDKVYTQRKFNFQYEGGFYLYGKIRINDADARTEFGTELRKSLTATIVEHGWNVPFAQNPKLRENIRVLYNKYKEEITK